MLGNWYLAGSITDISIKQNKKKRKLKEKRLVRWKVRVSPWFVAHAEDVISCANYYAS